MCKVTRKIASATVGLRVVKLIQGKRAVAAVDVPDLLAPTLALGFPNHGRAPRHGRQAGGVGVGLSGADRCERGPGRPHDTSARTRSAVGGNVSTSSPGDWAAVRSRHDEW